MTIRGRTTLLLPALALLLAACASPGASTGSASATDAGATERPSASATFDAPNGIPDAVWAAILTDLAGRLGHQPRDPAVVTAEATTWNDGSLGCPQPGQMYTQALVDGYHVILEIDGERYDYRIGGGDDLRLCDPGAGVEGDP